MPSSTYVGLANITLGSSAASVTFSSISQIYRDLVLVCQGTSASNSNWSIRLNSDTANYTQVYMYGAGSGSGGSGTDTASAVLGGGVGTSISQSIFNIMDYTATDKHKTVLNRTDKVDDATYVWVNRWASTSAVTTVLARCANGANFSTGTTFALYGIAS